MALEVAWSPEAVEDLESIGAYIERDSPFYARAVVSRIVGPEVAVIHGKRLIELLPDRFV